MSEENQNDPLPEQSEILSDGPGVPVQPAPEVGTVIAPDEPNPALAEIAPSAEAEGEGNPAPEDAPEGGVLDNTPRKPDASHAALGQVLAEEGDLSHEHLDEIEKRQDVSDVRILVAFLRRLLGDRGEPATDSAQAVEPTGALLEERAAAEDKPAAGDYGKQEG